jgi:DNA-binding NtrC family response regulator
LVVEDEEALRVLTGRVLSRAGYTALTASNGKEALGLLESHGKAPDLLLTDVIMPGMSGRDLSLELQRRHAGLKVLFMSGYTDAAIAAHGVLEHGIQLLGKPFTSGQLTKKVREVLDSPA